MCRMNPAAAAASAACCCIFCCERLKKNSMHPLHLDLTACLQTQHLVPQTLSQIDYLMHLWTVIVLLLMLLLLLFMQE